MSVSARRWSRVRAVTKAQLVEDGLWGPHLDPLLDEYVAALRTSADARRQADRQPFVTLPNGRELVHPGFARADEACRTAMALARALRLLPALRPKRPAGLGPFDALDALDELAPRRSRRTTAKENQHV